MAVEAEDQSGTPGVPAGAQAGVLGLLSIPAFRAVMAANVLSAIALGSSRFVYVWLVGELTEWNPATTILGIVIGLPPLLLSAWAGSLADRHAPRWLGLVLFSTVAISFAAVALLVVADLMTVVLAMVMGFLTTIAPSMLIPGIQALVPQVVPRDRLLQAVAIQNLGMMVSVIFGLFLGGAVIQAFGIAAGFWQSRSQARWARSSTCAVRSQPHWRVPAPSVAARSEPVRGSRSGPSRCDRSCC